MLIKLLTCQLKGVILSLIDEIFWTAKSVKDNPSHYEIW